MDLNSAGSEGPISNVATAVHKDTEPRSTEGQGMEFLPIETTSQLYGVRAGEEAIVPIEKALNGSERDLHDVFMQLSYLEGLVNKFISSPPDLATKTPIKGRNAWSYRLTRFGQVFFNALKLFPHALLEGHQFSPSIELLREVLKSYDFDTGCGQLPGTAKYPMSEFEHVDINPLCQIGFFMVVAKALQEKAVSKQFKARIQHELQEIQRAKKSMVKTMVRGFKTSKRLMLVRIDFEYKNDGGPMPSVEQLKSDWARFLNNRRHKSTFKHLLEYVWKVEEGLFRGPHIHAIFLFDGNAVQKDGFYGLELGRYWNEVITKNRGSFHVCNLKKGRYRYCGIGMVHVTEVDKLYALSMIIEYLAKNTQSMRISNANSYGSSQESRKPKAALGRPSKVLPDVVERFLMGTCTAEEFQAAMQLWSNDGPGE